MTPVFNVKKMKRYVQNDAFFKFLREYGWAKDMPLNKALEVYFNSEVIDNSVAEDDYNNA
jgi:hypothetical protein